MKTIRALHPIDGEYYLDETTVPVMMETDDEMEVTDSYALHLVALGKAEIIETP